MTLEQYRQKVADCEAEVERCKRLYEQTGSIMHWGMIEEAHRRLSQARQYLKQREKKEATR